MEDRRPHRGPAQVLRRKRGRRRRRGRPRLDRGRGLKGRGRGAGRRLQRAQAQRGTATHSPAADTGSERMSRGRRHRVVRDTCKQERKQLQQAARPSPSKRSTAAGEPAAAALVTGSSGGKQQAQRRHLPAASQGLPLGPAARPRPAGSSAPDGYAWPGCAPPRVCHTRWVCVGVVGLPVAQGQLPRPAPKASSWALPQGPGVATLNQVASLAERTALVMHTALFWKQEGCVTKRT